MTPFSPTVPRKSSFFIALFICTLIFYGFSLPFSFKAPHFSPSNDFSNHAHFMARFAESFRSGQWVPRTVPVPTNFSDGTSQVDNIPTFQYYGFFDGLAGLPFHLLNFSDTNSAVLSSIVVRFLGLLILFETCVLMGASYLTAFLACFSLLISPYTLTIFYGRGALSEAFAQPILGLIPYGYMLAYRGRIYSGLIAISMAFFLLPLSHNIFFLYGLIFLLVLATFNFQPKIILTMILGTVIGFLMSAWQWLPAHQTLKDIVLFGSMLSWKMGGPGVGLQSASWSGALGFPHPWKPDGFTAPLPLYHTIGWWTLPFIFLSIKGIYEKDKVYFAFPFFIASLSFIALTFWPFNEGLFLYLIPQFFDVIQDTSRLLGFVSLLGALSLAIAIPKITPRLFKILIVLMLISQIPVFNCFIHLVSNYTWPNENVTASPINYYYTSPNQQNNSNEFMSKEEGFQLRRSNGVLNPVNSFYIAPEKNNPILINLTGLISNRQQGVKISIAGLVQNSNSDDFKISSLTSSPDVLKGDFTETISVKTPSPSGWYKIIAAPVNSTETLSAVVLFRTNILSADGSNFIEGTHFEPLKKPHGYSRQYKLKKNDLSLFKPDPNGFYHVELPSAYSRLFTVKQNGRSLTFQPDFNHQILLKTNDITSPFKVSYRLDWISFVLTLLGFSGFISVLILQKNQKRI